MEDWIFKSDDIEKVKKNDIFISLVLMQIMYLSKEKLVRFIR